MYVRKKDHVETLNQKITYKNTMKKIPWWIWILGTYGILKYYEQLPPQTQQKIKSILNTHHGTLGGGIALRGVFTGNTPMMLVGGTMMYHDRSDAPYWVEDIRRIENSIKQKIQQFLDQA